MNRLELLCAALETMEYRRNVSMAELTTFRVGGPADVVVWPQTIQQVHKALAACKRLELPFTVIGNGSNLLVRDGGIRGMVLCIGPNLSQIKQDGNIWRAGAGCSLTALARQTVEAGCMGLEWACGIPGTLGGACAMNAGAYGGEMKQVLKAVTVLEGDQVVRLFVQEEDLGYRTSAFCAPARIVLEAELILKADDGGAAKRMEEYLSRRREKQPLRYPSAGSTFKRPQGYFAGQLIQQAGMKGVSLGGAQVSELHAGFIINRGQATAQDVIGLIQQVKEAVFRTSGVMLECEVKIIGEDA